MEFKGLTPPELRLPFPSSLPLNELPLGCHTLMLTQLQDKQATQGIAQQGVLILQM